MSRRAISNAIRGVSYEARDRQNADHRAAGTGRIPRFGREMGGKAE